MKSLSTKEILSLVNLTLIEDENVHYHQDPETQFYNQCHSEKDGKFCSGPGAGGAVSGKSTVRDSDGGTLINGVKVPEKRGRLGGSLVDPHEGTLEFDGVRGYDKKTLKPVPGTDAYLEAHNIPRETWNARPYIKYEADKKDPALLAAFPKDKYPEGHRLFLRTAEGTDPQQTGGYIMYKHPVPGSPHGEIAPQIRPNVPVVTDAKKRARALANLNESKEKLETLKKMSPEHFIKEKRGEVRQAEENLKRLEASTPESIKAETRDRLEAAKAKRDEVRATSDDPYIKKAAELEYNAAKREHDRIIGTKNKPGKADKPTYKAGLIESATLTLKSKQHQLENAIEDPKGSLDKEIKRWGGKYGTGERTKETTGGLVGSNQKSYDETAAKYLFTPGESSARIDCSQDPQNLKNLTKGKGRIYLAMEGSIKNDAILTSIKKEDPKAAVVNVPSVTLWQQKDLTPDVPQEIGWFANKYAKGRDVILVPDADGVTNNNVMLQAKALRTALIQGGADKVYIATPPLKPGSTKKLDEFPLPSGRMEERKGVDDHLGAGRGRLGQMHYETFMDYPNYDLTKYTVKGGAKGKEKMSAGAQKNVEKILAAISGLVEDKGIAVIPLKTLNQVAGFDQSQRTAARSNREILERLGIIKVEWVFDNKASGRGERVLNPNMTEKRRDELVAMGVIKEPHIYKRYTDVSIELSPVISILKPEYIIKSDARHVGAVSDLPGFKPPPTYKGWESAVTGKPDTTGIAKALEENHKKFLQKVTTMNGSNGNGKTVEDKLAAIKAPPGRRLVRTKAGSERYNIPIGQPIPFQSGGEWVSMTLLDSEVVGRPQVLNITSMVLLSSLVTEEEVIEFYNKCHDKGGLFCETPDVGSNAASKDGSKKSVSGKFLFGTHKNIQTVAKAVIGSVEVDGIKSKAVYEIKTEDGHEIKLFDKSGNVDGYKDELLETEAKMHNLYPLNPPRNIVVTKPSGLFRDSEVDPDTFAIVHGNNPNVYVNSDKLGIDVGKFSDGFQMPSAKTGNTKNMEYLLEHEYGHQVDFAKHSNGGYSYHVHPLYHNPAFRQSLSKYGLSDPKGIEAYAETFAEWNYSKGRTKNPAAIAMARYEGWAKPNELRASAATVSMVLLDTIRLANDSIKESPSDTEEDINADIPTLGGKGVSVIDSLHPKIVGDFTVIDPSSEDTSKADKIIRDVYFELRLDYPDNNGEERKV